MRSTTAGSSPSIWLEELEPSEAAKSRPRAKPRGSAGTSGVTAGTASAATGATASAASALREATDGAVASRHPPPRRPADRGSDVVGLPGPSRTPSGSRGIAERPAVRPSASSVGLLAGLVVACGGEVRTAAHSTTSVRRPTGRRPRRRRSRRRRRRSPGRAPRLKPMSTGTAGSTRSPSSSTAGLPSGSASPPATSPPPRWRRHRSSSRRCRRRPDGRRVGIVVHVDRGAATDLHVLYTWWDGRLVGVTSTTGAPVVLATGASVHPCLWCRLHTGRGGDRHRRERRRRGLRHDDGRLPSRGDRARRGDPANRFAPDRRPDVRHLLRRSPAEVVSAQSRFVLRS